MGLILDLLNFKFYALSTKNTPPMKAILTAEHSILTNVCDLSEERICSQRCLGRICESKKMLKEIT